jgi:arylsulfatase
MSIYFGPKYAPPRSAHTHFEYLAGTENIPPTVCPQIFNRSYTVSADLKVPETGAEGVIMANADYLGGYALYVEDKKPRFTYSFMGIKNFTSTSSDDLPTGKVNLRYEFVSDKPGQPGAGGTSKLFLNGKQVAEGQIEHTMAQLTTSYAGFDIGKDNGLPVSRSYESKLPFAFTGEIDKVTFDLGQM